MKSMYSKNIISILFILIFCITSLYAQSENDKISNLLEQKKAFNKANRVTSIFKIQIYNGNESGAYKAQQDFQIQFPNYKTLILYKSPEWKTQVGYFCSRLEADKNLLIIKQKFNDAIVLEDKM